jgi:hypothetical protein
LLAQAVGEQARQLGPWEVVLCSVPPLLLTV